MRFSIKSLTGRLAMAAGLLLAANVASALPIDLSTPAGLNPGDKFRFLTVTTGSISNASSDINVYNTFVQNAAGGVTYNSVLVNWKAIGTTATTFARDNVGGFGTNVPVYKPFTGTRVANDLTTSGNGLWSGSLLAAPNETFASVTTTTVVWTGASAGGLEGSLSGFPLPLGGSFSMIGSPSSTTGAWISSYYPEHPIVDSSYPAAAA